MPPGAGLFITQNFFIPPGQESLLSYSRDYYE